MNRKVSGCMMLFSLPFAAVGVGMGSWLFYSIATYWQVRNWEEARATILQTELIAHPGDDSTTWEVTAEYRYTFKNRKYTGRRVAIDNGNDNIGDFHHKVYEELKKFQQNRDSTRCYVNPQRPDEALLYRELRWPMIFFKMAFAAIFGAVGFGIFAAGLVAFFQRVKEGASADQSSDAPWLSRADWASGRIVYSETAKAVIIFIVAFIWNAVASPAWLVLAGRLPAPEGNLKWVVYGIAGVGGLLLLWAFRAWRSWRKYGESVFQMASVPGVIGGQLAGVVQTSAKIQPEDGFRVKLSCIQQVTSGSGDDRSTRETTLWEDERVISLELATADPGRSAIPVLFGIPYNCRPSDVKSSDDRAIWRLEVTAATSGSNYNASFEVPVFQTPESNPNFKLADNAMADYEVPQDAEQVLRRAGVIRTTTPDGAGQRFIFPATRNMGITIGHTAFTAVWSGAVYAMWIFGVPMWITIIFGLFDLLMLGVMLDLWLYRSSIDVTRSFVAVDSGWMGMGSHREIPISDIKKFDTDQSMQTNKRVFYNLYVVVAAGKKVKFAKNVSGNWTAKAIIKAIEEAMERKTK